MEKFLVCLTHEDAVKLEMTKAEAGEQDRHYAEMSLNDYISVLVHRVLNPAGQTDEEL